MNTLKKWSDGKIDEKIALKPGNFGILQPLVALTPYGVKHFFLASRKSLRKAVFTNQNNILIG